MWRRRQPTLLEGTAGNRVLICNWIVECGVSGLPTSLHYCPLGRGAQVARLVLLPSIVQPFLPPLPLLLLPGSIYRYTQVWRTVDVHRTTLTTKYGPRVCYCFFCMRIAQDFLAQCRHLCLPTRSRGSGLVHRLHTRSCSARRTLMTLDNTQRLISHARTHILEMLSIFPLVQLAHTGQKGPVDCSGQHTHGHWPSRTNALGQTERAARARRLTLTSTTLLASAQILY